MIKPFLAVATVCALWLSGCASTPTPVRVDAAEGGLPNCQSFAWLPPAPEAASLTDQRVQAAVMAQLEAKGYAQSSDKPDCRITYLLTTHELPESKPRVGVGAGGGSGGIGGGIGISLPIGRRNQEAGTLVIDVIDAAKNAQVWSGSLEAAFEKKEPNDDELHAAIERVLAQYPDRKQ